MKKATLNCPFCSAPYTAKMVEIWKGLKKITPHAEHGVICSTCGEKIWKQ